MIRHETKPLSGRQPGKGTFARHCALARPPPELLQASMVKRHFQHPGFFGLAGAARFEITPPVGIYARNWGAAARDAAGGVHRPLFVTALALADEAAPENPLVLVSADLGWWRSPATERAFRRRLLDALGLDEARLVFALTHTHAAPPLVDGPEPGWEGGELLVPWLGQVETASLAAVRGAVAAMRPGSLEWRYGRCGLATARDLADPEETGRFLCGFDPGAPADDTLLVGRVAARSGGEPLALVVNYACHPTTLAWDNALVSPDYLGAMRETTEEAWAGGLTLFAQGASGELSPRYQYVGDPARRTSARASAFAATLELVREGVLDLRQETHFAPIFLRDSNRKDLKQAAVATETAR